MDKLQQRRERLAKWKAEQEARKAKPAPSIKIVAAAKPKPRLSLDGDDLPPSKKLKPEPVEVGLGDLNAFMGTLEDESMNPVRTISDIISDEDEINGDSVEDPLDPLSYLRQVQQNNRKEIPKTDHSQAVYHSFRKEFYVQPAESDLGDELKEARQAMGIVVQNDGHNLAPVTDWMQLGLPRPLLEIITARNMTRPTDIQAQALPLLMSGRDVIGIAPTGSGKTIAFVLPLIRQVLDQLPEVEGVKAFVLSPTRELCVQTFREVDEFARPLGIATLAAAGGTPVKEQIDSIKRGVDIIVATPGRMIDLLAANGGKLLRLNSTTFVVIDEADRMFDMGFAPQVKRILENVRPDRQSAVISATFPAAVERHVRNVLHDPVLVEVGTRSSVSREVQQVIEVVPQERKFLALLQVLGSYFKELVDGQAIVFVDRQDPADQLAEMLTSKSYKCRAIHGGHDQKLRDETLALFRAGKLPLLIATSVAARGLDVKGLGLVVNFDPPNHLEDYVHRVGRTGRAGLKGRAVTFLTAKQARAAHDIAQALKLSDQPVPSEVAELAAEYVPPQKKVRLAGFGGHGLERLDSERNEKRQAQLEPEEEATPQPSASPEPSRSSAVNHPKPIVKIGPAPGIKGPATANFHTTLVINDYPQTARLAVTSFQNQSKVIEQHSVSITNRGTFYPPGKEGPDKLYLAIEGPTEVAVADAFHDLTVLLREGIDKSVKVGKYSV